MCLAFCRRLQKTKHKPSTSAPSQEPSKSYPVRAAPEGAARKEQRETSINLTDESHQHVGGAWPTSEKYEYIPLSGKDHFRLLRVREVHDPTADVQLCCSIDVFPVGSSPPFTSLSYTWGAPFSDADSDEQYGPHHLLEIGVETAGGRKKLAIRRNLHEGLVQVVRNGFSGYLWVDAICIDEENRPERAMQVFLMHRIFGRCDEVIVWLGRADDTLEDVAWLLDQVHQSKWVVNQPDEAVLFYEWTAKGLEGSKEWLRDVLIAGTPLSDKKWLSYYRFLQRNYMHRTWTVQEIALAPKTRVICGDKELSWRALTVLSLMLSDTEYARVLTIYERKSTNRARASHSFVGLEVIQLALCRALCQADKHAGLLDRIWGMQDSMTRCLSLFQETLLVTWARAASEPRDKVYGALGIAMKSLPEHMGAPIKPDYSIPVAKLYIKTSWILIHSLRPLLLLSYAGRNVQRVQGLPSWAIDFTGPDGSDNLMSANSKRGSLYWSSSLSLPQNSPRKLHGNVLSVLGATLDVIEAIYKMNILDVLRACVSIMPQYHTGTSSVEVTWRTLTATSNTVDASKFRDNFRAWIKWSIHQIPREDEHARDACLEILDGLCINEHTLELPSRTEITAQTLDEETIEGATTFQALIRGFHIFRTSKGYIGSAPQGIKEHDQVWMVCDAITPLVFRPVDDTGQHVLIREAYVHGFMHGEAKLTSELQQLLIR